jgi:hypothetical protein
MSVRRVIAVSTMLWMAATAAAFVASPRGATGERQALALTDTVPAAGATGLTLVLSGGYHAVDVRASEPGAPDVVTISMAGHTGSGLALIAKPVPAMRDAALATHLANGMLTVDLLHADSGLLRTEWTITVPARFGARVTIDTGRVLFEGLEGPLTARVAVGAIRADVSAAQHGPADLDSTVGRVSVSLNGEYLRGSGKIGPGSHWVIPAAGFGSAPISLHVTVGSAALLVR